MEIKKLITDKENLLFIGYDGFEEFYLEMDSDFGGWSFMGLRPETEDNLRARQRETEPEDVGMTVPSTMTQYFDYDSFADDMEENWYDFHDVQAERENEEGDTLYLGFGTGTDIKNYFKQNGIKSYEDYVNHFEFVGLTKKEFKKLKKQVGL